jgi:hypothetical protein
MNELELLAELGNQTPLVPVAQLGESRERLVAAIAAEPAGTSFHRPQRRHRFGRRAIVLAGVAGTAAAAVVALVIPGGAPPQGASPVQDASLTAAGVLDNAAVAALSQSPVSPRPGQFVYTKVLSGGQLMQTWQSVDGKRNSLEEFSNQPAQILPGCVNGHTTVVPLQHVTASPHAIQAGSGATPAPSPTPAPSGGREAPSVPCTVQPAFFPGMPDSAGQMLAYLEKTQGVTPGNLNKLAKTVGWILQSDYLRPAQRAAMFRMLATLPGLSLVRDARDVDGRPGVGVAWEFEGSRVMIIFASPSYAYLGETTWSSLGQQGGDALLETAVVSRAGQLP